MINRNLTIENARLIFRNFSGKEGRFNAQGKRNFCVCLDPDTARELADDGWNVRQLTPRDAGDPPQNYISVQVKYGARPPRVFLITDNGKTALDESTIHILDWAELENVDLIVTPYNWEIGGKTGVTAYLKTMYATIATDDLERKYADCPDSAMSAVLDDEVPFE